MRASLSWVSAAAGLVATVLVVGLVSRAIPRRIRSQLGATRTIEARFGIPELDRYRRYTGPAASQSAPLDLPGMARLERQGDVGGLAAAFLLSGEYEQARRVLTGAGQATGVDNEQAVLALLQHRPQDALAHLERALERHPRSAAALWNRGLALRDLGLPRAGSEAFAEVAALHEPGWSEDARSQGQKMSEASSAGERSWKELLAAGESLGARQQPPAARFIADGPDVLRYYFYEAVRGAPDSVSLTRLRPLAQQLDAHFGGETLGGYLERILGASFAARAPMAAAYAKLAAEHWKGPAATGLSEQLRQAGEDASDIRFGALLSMQGARPDQADLIALARQQDDPWLNVLVMEKSAAAAGNDEEREATLLRAIAYAQSHKLEMRRLRLQTSLVYLLLRHNRLSEAGALLEGVRTSAHAAHLWNIELDALYQLAGLSSHRKESASLEAFGKEVLLRDRACPLRARVEQLFAERATNDRREERARRALDELEGCEGEVGMAGLSAASELARLDPGGADGQRFSRMLASMRPRLNGADTLFAAVHEGRVLIAIDRQAGRRQLLEVIGRANAMPRQDPTAIKLRLLAHRALISNAAAAGEYDEALSLMAAESELTVPQGCVLGISEDMKRLTVVARSADGRLQGESGAIVSQDTPERVVSPALRRTLADCGQVAAIALPPFQGKPRLLGPEVVWRHQAERPAGSDSPSSTERRLVVSDAVPAPGSTLPELGPWPQRPGAALFDHLTGRDANPTRVKTALAQADYVDFHVHGVLQLDLEDQSYLVLSPDPEGKTRLTAKDIRSLNLPRHPFIVLAACNSAASSPYFSSYSGHWSLPSAFLEAGARGVLAAARPIPDRPASDFFEDLALEIQKNGSAARALRDVRVAWLQKERTADWVQDVVVYE